VHTVQTGREGVVFVVAVTREAAARARLARQLPAETVLLIVPDYSAAEGAFRSGVFRTTGDETDENSAVITVGGLVIDQLRQYVTWNGAPLGLTRLERGVLGCLAEPPMRVWPHDRLYRAVWRDAWLGDASTLHATAKRLRRKLREAGVTVCLESVRGVGFRLEANDVAMG
jgi:two-component system, OmpR family, response regulator MtrA